MSGRLQSIQLLRAVAVIAVVFFHFAGLRHGKAGVDLFFVISGFVMAGLMHQSPGTFARDRFVRIYPPFLAALAFAFALFPQPLGAEKIVKTLLLWPIHQDIFLYPAWSLSYEAMFYAACVASMFVPGRYVIAAYAVMFVLGVPFFGSGLVLEFLAGFAIARRQWWALPVLLAAAAFEPRVLLYGPPAALLLWLALSGERWFKHRLWAPVAMIGDASYAIYLTHVPVGSLLFGKVPAAALVYACLLVGIGFHFVVEKPLLRWVRRAVPVGRPLIDKKLTLAQLQQPQQLGAINMQNLVKMLGNKRGASAAEYALILAIIGAVIALAALGLSEAIGNAMDDTANCINTPTTGSC